jgi:glycosyltransferase involved in cell wall biosynthesis
MTKTSVVIPAYNAERVIKASVESALRQTFDDLEVIVIDDGSSDKTIQQLQDIKDRRLRVMEREHQGLAATLNAGAAAAEGSYIGFLDADDLWLENKVARHVAHLEAHPEVDVTFSWSRVVDEYDRPVAIHSSRCRGAMSYRQLLADFAIRTMSAVVMRRSALERSGGFSLTLARCIDLDFFLRVALQRPNNIWAIPETLTLYRRHPGQRTKDWMLMQQAWTQVMESMRRLAPAETAAVERVASSNMHRYFSWLAYENGEFRTASDLLQRSFQIFPRAFVSDTRNWQLSAACLAYWILPARVHSAIEGLAGFHRRECG